MKSEQVYYSPKSGWVGESTLSNDSNLVLVFGPAHLVSDPEIFNEIRSRYAHAQIVFCSAVYGIGQMLLESSRVVVTASYFEKTLIRASSTTLLAHTNEVEAGEYLRNELFAPDLKHILVFSDGVHVNGDELISGMNEGLSENVLVSGGFAGSSSVNLPTYVGLNSVPEENSIVAIGFYGDQLVISSGVESGWDEFGPVRTVTHSEGNVLYSLDDINALDLYKKYLGDQPGELSIAVQHFPLCILHEDGSRVVRSVFRINESNGSLVYSGNIPPKAKVRFMIANVDRLVNGAVKAAELAKSNLRNYKPELVLIVSCVGRRILLQERTEEEIEVVREAFGSEPIYCGFYANGELSPATGSTYCSLHNQTLSLTIYSEQ